MKRELYKPILLAAEFFAEEARPEKSEPFYIGPETYDSLWRAFQIAERAIAYVDVRTGVARPSEPTWQALVEAVKGPQP